MRLLRKPEDLQSGTVIRLHFRASADSVLRAVWVSWQRDSFIGCDTAVDATAVVMAHTVAVLWPCDCARRVVCGSCSVLVMELFMHLSRQVAAAVARTAAMFGGCAVAL